MTPVFLNISKAFDKVWHEGRLIFKLKENDISSELLHILFDFLSNRKQRVVPNGQNSSWTNDHAGVQQGSILGPLLFLIYINDLSDNLTNNAKRFADDTLFSVVHDVNTSAKKLNNDLKKVNDWAFQWKMSFNPDPNKQAQDVIFSRKSKRSTHSPLVFSNNNVSQTYSQKHLGVILHFILTFTEHLNNVLATQTS